MSCMVIFKTSYGVIQQSLYYSTIYSSPEVDCPSTNLQRANDLSLTTIKGIAGVSAVWGRGCVGRVRVRTGAVWLVSLPATTGVPAIVRSVDCTGSARNRRTE